MMFAENGIHFWIICSSLLGHSSEEDDVLQHACADGSEEAERDTSQFDGEKENHVGAAWRSPQKNSVFLKECRYHPWEMATVVHD